VWHQDEPDFGQSQGLSPIPEMGTPAAVSGPQAGVKRWWACTT
jgi:hypothetical protein